MRKLFKRALWLIAIAAGVGMLAFAFVPKPVGVDVGRVDRAAMQVTVGQEGKTRVKDRYIVAAPLAGEMERIELKAGDPVQAGKTVLARILPLRPAFLDVRAEQEAESRVRAAEATLGRADPEIARIEAELLHATLQHARRKLLATNNAMSQQELEDAALAEQVSAAQLRSAQAAKQVAAFELEQARAALLSVTTPATSQPATFEIRSPIDGQILRVIQESRAPVTPGTQLLELGDVRQLEAVIDVLSRDAVAIRPGAKVYFDRWGGEQPLVGSVRRVEPSGFTKISALGVEEQRVNIIADLNLPEADRPIGDFFRVDARIVIWERPDALQVPSGALFRDGQQWAVYLAKDGQAVLRQIKLGRMSGVTAEVLEGLSPGDEVILHPSDKIKDGVSVAPREASGRE